MTINEYPRLCGGTFFTLVLQALRQRMKAREHYSGDSDGLSDPEVLVGLIKVINPDYADPGKENLKGTANNYKACKTSNSAYLPFDDEQVVSAFDSVVRADYQTALNGMIGFVNDFLDVGETVHKDVNLVRALIDLIQQDQTIKASDEFYIGPNGEKKKKAALGDLKEVCLPSFLLGVWHYVVLNRRDNANTEAAIDSINKILRDSGFQGFSIRAKAGVENVYEVIREDGSVAENLSEGERNFIAFLYFYHQVRGSMSSEELKEKIVVIDDPVSSMDSTALFLVSAIVREMVNVCRNNTEYLNPKVPGDYIKQLFVLTHNVYFHREVTYQQVGYYNCTSFYMIRKNDNISTIKLCKRQSKDVPTEEENYNPVQNSYAALWDELRDIQSTIPALNVMRRILEYYFLQLCGYEGSDLREIVLEKPENRSKFIKQVEGEKPDMTDYQLASSLLAYINNPNGISDGLNYVEDCEDVDAYKRVFQMIFEALGQSQHYKMMTGKRIKS